MSRRWSVLVALVLMAAFAFGVNRFLASRQTHVAAASNPVEAKPAFILPGTLYLAAQGDLFSLTGGKFTDLHMPSSAGTWMQPALVPGTQNIVANVELLKGDLSESWDEGDLQYATAYMRWRALDYVVRLGRSPGDPDYIVSGDPRTAVEAEEVWTFVRRPGGTWLLSAIQQV